MINKYEKEESKMEAGETVKNFKEVSKKDATHLHICKHDDGLPCKRIKL